MERKAFAVSRSRPAFLADSYQPTGLGNSSSAISVAAIQSAAGRRPEIAVHMIRIHLLAVGEVVGPLRRVHGHTPRQEDDEREKQELHGELTFRRLQPAPVRPGLS